MQIKKDSVVSLSYEMFDAQDELLDASETPMVYLHGGYDGIFPQVEEALHGKTVGDDIDVTMVPEFAFGEYDETLIRREPADLFPEDIEVGMMFEADDDETGELMVFTVVSIENKQVVLDGNHPLAGKTLRFKAKVVEVRDATKDELEHGHAHDPNHDHHH
ncbi:peptidylprolyl isomerase [Leeia sp. TBRC 13508]|uniref:peptidylprolyl isomerase n=1 Tax=Leeia speluncae TaxID=2884804 RepID=A0ABS8D1B6_9NEIS|nr:peptidylprolyl isomerase [Leeia speluncae]MCB6181982.1 peptidylprolyl isomerase [Leeia speluncae]